VFVDELKLHMKSGKGGNGVVRWLHQKNREFGGPSGGDGGRGGDVYLVGFRDFGILSKYSHDPEFIAGSGEDGGGNSKEGKNGKDMEVKIPVGSILTRIDTTLPMSDMGQKIEILSEDDRVLILKGGRGGLGNEHFKSSTNRNPMEFTKGKPGEEANYHLELRLIADAGFIGLPSAGKSSLLNALTNAKSKVAEYHFTTLEPHLGDFYGHILADIPGLIEGASEGKGLGHKFLRHITRVKVLFHLISMESEDPLDDYKTIRKELEDYDEVLAEKEEVIILSKTDTASPEVVKATRLVFEKLGKKVLETTILDDNSINKLGASITDILK
jgi:GTPase